jgi:signal peptidase II
MQFNSHNRWFAWACLVITIMLADQWIKGMVLTTMPLYASVEITPWFNWVHVLNTGAAFSFLANAGGWQRYFFGAVGTLVSLGLLFWLWRGVNSRLETAAYIAIAGGGMGNVVDRIRLGAVVDYLDFHWQGWHWPAFNLADISVVIGAALLVLTAYSRSPSTSPKARLSAPS